MTREDAADVVETLIRESVSLSTLAAQYDDEATKRHGLVAAVTKRGAELRARAERLMDAALKIAGDHGMLPTVATETAAR